MQVDEAAMGESKKKSTTPPPRGISILGAGKSKAGKRASDPARLSKGADGSADATMIGKTVDLKIEEAQGKGNPVCAA